jgi:hypothetical protein
VRLTNSAPLFTANPKKIEPVAHATVEISENNSTWLKLEYDTAYKRYFIPQTVFPVHEGKTYYIRASASGFETVFASCTVPHFRETNLNFAYEESINDIHHGDMEPYLHYHSYLEWNDYPGEANYYMFCEKDFTEYFHYYFENGTTLVDSFHYYNWYLLYDMKDKPCIYSDKGQDGKKISAFIMLGLPEFFETTFIQADVNCYMYETSAMDYDAIFQSFLLEPAQLYSNVKNGYGLFGAFVMKEYVFESEEEKK